MAGKNKKSEPIIIGKKNQAKQSSVKGQESVSGHMPTPDSDDNVLDNAHRAGLYPEADEETPVELDIAKQLDKPARKRKGITEEEEISQVPTKTPVTNKKDKPLKK